MNYTRADQPRGRVGVAGPAALLLAVSLGIVSSSAPAHAGEGVASPATGSVPGVSVASTTETITTRAGATPVERAKAALARATKQLDAGHGRRARRALDSLERNVRRAHHDARSLIGQPPADPESDEPPGPAAVLQVLGLDHRIGLQLVPRFDGPPRDRITQALGSALAVTHRRRDAIVEVVVALPPEGDGDEYTDGMSDTLTHYTQEVRQLTSGLASYRLTDLGSAHLTLARQRVQATQATMDAAYGGGE